MVSLVGDQGFLRKCYQEIVLYIEFRLVESCIVLELCSSILLNHHPHEVFDSIRV